MKRLVRWRDGLQWCRISSLLTLLLYGLVCQASGNDGITRKAGDVGDASFRVLHFVLRGIQPERARWIVAEARKAGFNSIQVVITDGVRLDNAPWKPDRYAWTKAEFYAWVRDIRAQGMEVIPELQLLTHQEKFFQDQQRNLMYNGSTYDPRREETYKRTIAVLNEIIVGIRPKIIHIGHDEVAGFNGKPGTIGLGSGEKMLPGDLFLKDVLRIHKYLKRRGLDVWMWGDMLIAPDEFPGMLANHLHGSSPDYGKVLRGKLPRDIVICDWHYFDGQADFPSLVAMQKEGFRVIGATWKKEETIHNFTRYAAQHGAYGMMATTWFHVQKKEWDVVERIIRESGENFRRFFPDAN